MSDYQEGHLATTRILSLDSFKLCLPMWSSKKPPSLDTVTLEWLYSALLHFKDANILGLLALTCESLSS